MMTRSDPEGQLWDELESVEAGLLTIGGVGQLTRPLSLKPDRRKNTVWFSTHQRSEIVAATGKGAEADLCIVGRRHDYHARLSGMLSVSNCQETLKRLWSNPASTRQFGGIVGKEMMLLRLKLTRGDMWASVSCPAALGEAFAVSDPMPIPGPASVRAHIRFHHFENQSNDQHASHDEIV